MNVRTDLLSCIPALLFAAASLADPTPAIKQPMHHPKPAATLTNHNVTAAEKSAVTPGSEQTLNPQPLPPKWGVANSAALRPVKPPAPQSTGVIGAGAKSSLNPQPLPPKVGNANAVNAGDAVSLNPQPLPPKVGAFDPGATQRPSQP